MYPKLDFVPMALGGVLVYLGRCPRLLSMTPSGSELKSMSKIQIQIIFSYE